MKLAITSKGNTLDAQVDPRFGRAAKIIIVDSETEEFSVIDNSENSNSLKGAGIQAATVVSESGAQVLLTGHCGPNAYKACNAANIKVVNDVSGSIKDAITLFKSGKCAYAENANVEGHW